MFKSWTNKLSDAVDNYFISDFLKQLADTLLRMIGETCVAADSRPLRFLVYDSCGTTSALEWDYDAALPMSGLDSVSEVGCR